MRKGIRRWVTREGNGGKEYKHIIHMSGTVVMKHMSVNPVFANDVFIYCACHINNTGHVDNNVIILGE